MSDSKAKYRLTLEERHNNPSRVFSFKFPKNARAQDTRKWLESVEADFYNEEQREVPLWEIIAAIAEHMQHGKISPFDTEKRMIHVVMKRLESMEGLLSDIASRDPVIYQQATEAHAAKTGERIESDFISSMLDDFDNVGER